MIRVLAVVCLLLAGALCAGRAEAGTTYHIATAGSDTAGCGTSASPCASPNGVAAQNALACGDTISAASGTYSQPAMSITATPSCTGQNDVVMVECATPFACNGTTQIQIGASYWGIEGWVMTGCNVCFVAQPPSTANIGTIAFVDNIANGASQGGIVYASAGSARVGNTATIGNIVFNAAQATGGCDTGITHGGMGNFLLAGDELYAAWNFSYGNVTGGPSCNGGTNGDQTGLNFDTMGNYTGTAAAENNWLGWNGGPGFELVSGNSTMNAGPVIVRYNTLVANAQWPQLASGSVTDFLGGIVGVGEQNVTYEYNIVSGNSTVAGAVGLRYGPHSTPLSVMDNNWLYQSVTGRGDNYWGDASTCLAGHASPIGPFTNANNIGCAGNSFTTNPGLMSTTKPSAPSCSGQPDTLTCFAAQIANLQSSSAGSTTWGAQVAAPTDSYNSTPFLCHVYAEMPASMFRTSGGPIPNRCGQMGPIPTPTIAYIPCGASINAFTASVANGGSGVYGNGSGITFQLAGAPDRTCTYAGQTFHTQSGETIEGDCSSPLGRSTVLDGTGLSAAAELTDGYADGSTGVTLQCLTVQHYTGIHAANCTHNQLATGDGWVLAKDTFAAAGCNGVDLKGQASLTNSRIVGNGTTGVFSEPGYSSNSSAVQTVTGNEIGWNGSPDSIGATSAGLKSVPSACAESAVATQGTWIAYNWVHDNTGPGIWWDCWSGNAAAIGNTVDRNGAAGIMCEISVGCTIEGNVLHLNGADQQLYQGDIFVASSSNATVANNFVEVSAVWSHNGGPIVQAQCRADVPQAEVNDTVTGNTVVFDGNTAGQGVVGQIDSTNLGANCPSDQHPASWSYYSASGNTFWSPATADPHWTGNVLGYGTSSTLAAIQGSPYADDVGSMIGIAGAPSAAGCAAIGCTGSGWPGVAPQSQAIEASAATCLQASPGNCLKATP